jgi:hypothetical protein
MRKLIAAVALTLKEMQMKKLIAAVAAVALTLIAIYFKNSAYEEKFLNVLRMSLIDSDSMKVRNITYNDDRDVMCGEVNSKNRLGGYVGFNYFYVDISEGRKYASISDGSDGHFHSLFCRYRNELTEEIKNEVREEIEKELELIEKEQLIEEIEKKLELKKR